MKTLRKAHQALPTLSTLAVLLCLTPLAAQAQYEYETDNGTITITRYTGPGGVVTIPDTIDGLPVSSLRDFAFSCSTSLINITIGNSVTTIGNSAFEGCTSLTKVNIGRSITSIADYAFIDCVALTEVYFSGNAPSVGADVFSGDNNVTVYYLPGTTGWGPTFAGRPALVMGDYTWHVYGGHLYALTRSTGTWIDHEAEAVSLGGHLVTINSEAEDIWLATIFDGVQPANRNDDHALLVQIGYYFNASHNAWEWISGQPVTYIANLYAPFPEGGTHAYLFEASNVLCPYGWSAAPWHTEPNQARQELAYGVIELDGDGRPIIATQPLSQVVWAGTTRDLYVQAVGSAPLAYQWRFNGTNLVDATGNTLTLANVQEANEGNYDVVVTNEFGSATSRVAVLTVIRPGEVPTFLTNGLVAYYPFNGNAIDESGNGNHGVVGGAMPAVDRHGRQNCAFYFPGNGSHVTATVTECPIGGSPRTTTAWFSTERTDNDYNMIVEYGHMGIWRPVVWCMAIRNSALYFESGSRGDPIYSQNVVDGLWHFGAITYDGSSVRLFVDGVLRGSVNTILNTTWDPVYLHEVWIGHNAFYPDEYYRGLIDDVRIYNRSLSQAEVKALYDYESWAGLLFSAFALNELDFQFNGFVSGDDRYHLTGSFVLGQDSDGVDLVAEDAVITVGSKKITLPAGTLSKQGSAYRWQGNLEGVQMAVLFEDRGSGAFGFDIQAAGLDLSGVLNPVVVQLLLGNDLGKTTNRLAGELHLPQPPDTTPPQLTVAGTPMVLWPPDGKYRRIQVSDFVLSVVDAEDKALSLKDVVITRVTSDEPDDASGSGDGNTVNDIVIGDTGQWVDLRAERQGRGNGRVYTIQVSATDVSGNVGTALFEVQVPHDQGGRSVKDAVAATVTRDIGLVSRTLAGAGLSAVSAATISPAPALGGELQLDGRGMFMRWQSTEGQAYRVEYKQSLTDPDWVPLGIDILGRGEVLAVRVPTTVYPQRFYRLRAVE